MEIGSLYKFNRKISEAEEYYGKALDICFKTLDNVNPQVYGKKNYMNILIV